MPCPVSVHCVLLWVPKGVKKLPPSLCRALSGQFQGSLGGVQGPRQGLGPLNLKMVLLLSCAQIRLGLCIYQRPLGSVCPVRRHAPDNTQPCVAEKRDSTQATAGWSSHRYCTARLGPPSHSALAPSQRCWENFCHNVTDETEGLGNNGDEPHRRR